MGIVTRVGLRWRRPAASVNYRAVFSSDGKSILSIPKLYKNNFLGEEESCSCTPHGGLRLGQTEQLNVGRKITLTL
jgi:hypothetical protein